MVLPLPNAMRPFTEDTDWGECDHAAVAEAVKGGGPGDDAGRSRRGAVTPVQARE